MSESAGQQVRLAGLDSGSGAAKLGASRITARARGAGGTGSEGIGLAKPTPKEHQLFSEGMI
jgi:hypothetical protein